MKSFYDDLHHSLLISGSELRQLHRKEESERIETAEEVQKFVDQNAASNVESVRRTPYTTIVLIEKTDNIINVTHCFSPNQSAVKAIIEQTKKKKEFFEEQRQQKAAQRRREEYLKLKEEFEDVKIIKNDKKE